MENLFKILFFIALFFTLNNTIYAQRVEVDSTDSKEFTQLFVNNDSLLVDELIYGNEKELLIFTKSTGEIYINKPKEKKFISVDVK